MTLRLCGIRGATVADANTEEAILAATQELLQAMLQSNRLEAADIASIFFSVGPELNAAFPAAAARQLGLSQTPLMCMTEIPVEGGLSFCVRVLIHANLSSPQSAMRPVYLKEAATLRPDVVR